MSQGVERKRGTAGGRSSRDVAPRRIDCRDAGAATLPSAIKALRAAGRRVCVNSPVLRVPKSQETSDIPTTDFSLPPPPLPPLSRFSFSFSQTFQKLWNSFLERNDRKLEIFFLLPLSRIHYCNCCESILKISPFLLFCHTRFTFVL